MKTMLPDLHWNFEKLSAIPFSITIASRLDPPAIVSSHQVLPGRAPTIAGPRHLRVWARTIHHTHPHLGGIAYGERFPGKLWTALLKRVADAFPRTCGPISATVLYRPHTPNRKTTALQQHWGITSPGPAGGYHPTVLPPPRQISRRYFLLRR